MDEIRRNVDRSFDDLFRGMPGIPVQIVNEQRAWNGNTLAFTFTAKMGFLQNPVKGTVEIGTDYITVDADLGLFEKFLGGKDARSALESKVRGLLT